MIFNDSEIYGQFLELLYSEGLTTKRLANLLKFTAVAIMYVLWIRRTE